MARYKSGETQVLTNCFLASYGFDAPETACIVLARPTRSLVLYLQMLGRGLRPAEEHPDCLILDHSGAVHWHGLATDARKWSLEGDYAASTPPPKKKDEKRPEGKLRDCSECGCTYSGRRDCPECGYIEPRYGKTVTTMDGELVELSIPTNEELQDQQVLYAELAGYAEEKGYKSGWVSHKFKERTGAWPPRAWQLHPPIQLLRPSVELRRSILAGQRKWYRQKDQEGRQRVYDPS